MSKNSIIKAAVMRRVYAIWFARRLLNGVYPKLLVLGMIFVQLAFLVSFIDIWSNANLNPGFLSQANFWLGALRTTQLAVQVLLLAAALFSVLLLRDLYRAVWSKFSLLFRRRSLLNFSQ